MTKSFISDIYICSQHDKKDRENFSMLQFVKRIEITLAFVFVAILNYHHLMMWKFQEIPACAGMTRGFCID
jgi:hypothetical protein